MQKKRMGLQEESWEVVAGERKYLRHRCLYVRKKVFSVIKTLNSLYFICFTH